MADVKDKVKNAIDEAHRRPSRRLIRSLKKPVKRPPSRGEGQGDRPEDSRSGEITPDRFFRNRRACRGRTFSRRQSGSKIQRSGAAAFMPRRLVTA